VSWPAISTPRSWRSPRSRGRSPTSTTRRSRRSRRAATWSTPQTSSCCWARARSRRSAAPPGPGRPAARACWTCWWPRTATARPTTGPAAVQRPDRGVQRRDVGLMAPTELGRIGGAHQPPRAPLRIGPLRIRHWRLWLIPAALVVLNVVAAQVLAPHPPEPTVIPYSAFKEQVQAGRVAEITTRGDAIQGTFRGAGTPLRDARADVPRPGPRASARERGRRRERTPARRGAPVLAGLAHRRGAGGGAVGRAALGDHTAVAGPRRRLRLGRSRARRYVLGGSRSRSTTWRGSTR